jgi:Domain of unknown function (DUF3303)
MQFILTFTIPPVTRDKAIARFLETGGQPPSGVRLLGRWTQLDLCGGAHAGPRPGGSGAIRGAEAGETAVGAHRGTRG